VSPRLRASLAAADLAGYVAAQVNAMFPDGDVVGTDLLRPAVHGALPRLEHCFAQVNNKYFFDGQQAVFNHLHGDQYAMWLYFLANELYRQGGPAAACSKLFLLNKALHGCDIFYEVVLPSIFLLTHPLGTVLGRGNFSDYLLVYQRCGIGSNHDVYPTLGAHVTLRDSTIGNWSFKVALALPNSPGSNRMYAIASSNSLMLYGLGRKWMPSRNCGRTACWPRRAAPTATPRTASSSTIRPSSRPR
jgi:serine O-acetyltransferase